MHAGAYCVELSLSSFLLLYDSDKSASNITKWMAYISY